MTTDREAMQMALEALQDYIPEYDKRISAITALRERLEQSQQEPAPGYCKHCKQYTVEESLRREWRGLTNDDIADCCPYNLDEYHFARAIEAKLKERNA